MGETETPVSPVFAQRASQRGRGAQRPLGTSPGGPCSSSSSSQHWQRTRHHLHHHSAELSRRPSSAVLRGHEIMVHVQIVSAQFVSDTNCIGHKLYRAQIVSGTNCIGHKLYRAQTVSGTDLIFLGFLFTQIRKLYLK